MMTSAVKHPEKEPLIIIRKWQVIACEGNHCAAALLSFFEYWHNIRLAQAVKSSKENDIAEMHGDGRRQNESLLQFHNEEELEEGILGLYSAKTIREAIGLLTSKGFISVHSNPNPRYHFDKTKYFLFYPETVNAYLASDTVKLPDANNKKGARQGKKGGRCSEITGAIPETTLKTSLETVEEDIAACATLQQDTPKDTQPKPISLTADPESEERLALKPQAERVATLPKEVPKTPNSAAPLSKGDPLWQRILDLCDIDLESYTGGMLRFAKEMKVFKRLAATIEQVDRWEKWYEEHDWRGQKGQFPTVQVLRETWKHALSPARAKKSAFGDKPTGVALPPRLKSGETDPNVLKAMRAYKERDKEDAEFERQQRERRELSATGD